MSDSISSDKREQLISRYSSAPSAPSECEECGSREFIQIWSDIPDTDNKEVFLCYECPDCGNVVNDNRQELPRSWVKRVPTWEEIFGHPTPYDHQHEAIENALEVGYSGGYSVVEGGCGTGKTMIALSTAGRLIRDPDTKFRQVLVLTSVKQQLQQFEEDLRIINQNLPGGYDPLRAVTLVGKTDVCPFAIENEAGITKENVNKRCQELRGGTELLRTGPQSHRVPNQAAYSSDIDAEDQWAPDGTPSPYPPEIPSVSGVEYCPFYAGFKSRGNPYPVDDAQDDIATPDEAVRTGVSRGVCPHSAISTACNNADIVIANYTHVFDKNTLNITGELLNEETFLICDEAHMMPPRVRSILSKEIHLGQLENAIGELERAVAAIDEGDLSPADISGTALDEGIIRGKCEEEHINPALLPVIYQLLTGIKTISWRLLSRKAEKDGWGDSIDSVPDQTVIPLRDPSEITQGKIQSWASDQFNFSLESGPIWDKAETLADIISTSLNREENTYKKRAIEDIIEGVSEWLTVDPEYYYPELVVEQRESAYIPSNASSWRDYISTTLTAHNSMPRGVISSRLEDFGGGILMSATLEPMDVFTEVTGLEYLANMKSLRVSKQTYNVSFPEKNRLSLAVDLPRFTSSNRGGISADNPTRRQYAQALHAVVTETPGNVLIGMPSYAEAQWAADVLRQAPAVSKEILIDRSSSQQVTEDLKASFFAGDPKVLTTSLRGTLTEGVDYDGDKLKACVVCGIPIKSIGQTHIEAVLSAYRERFGHQRGFEYALTVPAVRKSRQALGRVIRGEEDVGVRVLLDERYCLDPDEEDSVQKYLSEQEQQEYTPTTLDRLSSELSTFWS